MCFKWWSLLFLIHHCYGFFPSPLYHDTLYVNQTYSGFPQDGGENTPFVSLTQALTTISDASPTHRYRILVEPGTYTEPRLHIIADVFLVGSSQNSMDISLDSDFDLSDPSWSVETNDTHISGLYGLHLVATHDNIINFTAGKSDFYIYDLTVENNINIFSTFDATRTFFANCLLNNGFNVVGTMTQISNVFLYGNGLTISSSTYFTQFIATGGAISGTVNATWNDGDAPLQLLLPRFELSSLLTLSGPGCNATVNRYYLIGSHVLLEDEATVFYYE